MKNRKFIFYCLLLTCFNAFSQVINNISTPVGVGDYKAQQEVHLKPPTGQVTPSGVLQGHLFIDKNIVVPNTYVSIPTLPTTIRPHNKALPVGTIEGTSSVDMLGAANYNFAINLPPGTNGMMPQLGISYNSNAGDGLLGMGWNIDGISAITRVHDNIFHDDFARHFDIISTITPATNITSKDAIALDGMRLIPQNGSNPSNYEYRLESEDFTRVTYKGSFFLVEKKNGLKMEYGNSNDSRLLHSSNRVVTWYLSKIYDNYGNYIEYKYNNTNNEITIKEINYTGNTGAGITPYNNIKFYYNNRSDLQTKYLFGDAINQTLLLREIEVFSEGVSINRYEFKYSYSTYNYLNEVIKFGKDNSNFNSTAIVYGLNPSASKTSNTSPLLLNGSTPAPANYDYFSADFNNDGKSDIFSLRHNNVVNPNTGEKQYTGWGLYINQGNGTSFNNTQSITFPNLGYLKPYNGFFNYLFGGAPNPDALQISDINGDGYTDLVYPVNSGVSNYVAIEAYTYNPTSNQLDKMALPTGISGLCNPGPRFLVRIPSGPFINNAYQSATGAGLTSMTMGDFNGDGKAELFSYFEETNPTGLSQISMFLFSTDWSNAKVLDIARTVGSLFVTKLNGNPNLFDNYSGFTAIDFDGDGRSELLGVRDKGTANEVFVVLRVDMANYTSPANPCSMLFSEMAVWPTNGSIFPADHASNGDYNGDGNLDFISHQLTQSYISFGKDNSFTFPMQLLSGIPGRGTVDRKFLSVDINNDGKTDLIELINNGSNIDINVAYGHELNTVGLTNFGSILSAKLPPNKDYAHPNCDFNYNGTPGLGGCFSPNTDLGDVFDSAPKDIPAYSVGDFDGDGNNDIFLRVNVGGQAQFRILFFKPNSKEKYVVKIVDGYDRFVDFSYSSIAQSSFIKGTSVSNYPLIKTQLPLNVVVLKNETGVGLVGSNSILNQSTFYSYEDLRVHQQGKGVLGFMKMSSANNLSNYTTISQNTINANFFFSRPLKTEVFYSPTNQLLTSNNYTYSTTDLTTHILRKRYYCKLTADNSINTTRNVTNGNSYVYDINGNITQQQNKITNGTNNTTIDYNFSNFVASGSWLPNTYKNVTRSIKYNAEPTFNLDGAFDYDLPTGSLKQIVSDPGSTQQKVNVDYLYDANTGVVTQVSISAPNDPLSPPVKITTYNYDTKFRTVIKENLPLGLVSESEYDFGWGKPKKMIGVDGLETKYFYDYHGRANKTIEPDGTTTTSSINWTNPFTVNLNDARPYNALFTPYYIETQQTGSVKTRLFFDMYNRKVKTESQSFNGQDISSSVGYDNKGNVFVRTSPYFIPLPSGQTVLETTDIYSNDLNLIQSSTTTDGAINNVTQYAYSFGANGDMQVNVTDPDGKVSSTKVDYTDRLIKATDNGGVIDYAYNSNGSVINTKLNGTMISSTTYDPFDRPLQTSEVNSGTRTFSYDSYNQIRSMQDAKSTIYTYNYDALNRLATSSIGSDNFVYTYVGSGFGKGQMQQIENTTNSTLYKYTYDNLSRLSQLEEMVSGKTFITKYAYDNLSRITKQTYPDNFEITRHYNTLGYPAFIKDAATNKILWQADEMDHLGNFNKYTLGNTVQTVCTYNNIGQPQSCVAGSIYNLSYNFDTKNGNLNSITDNVKGLFENYQYDNLDRLITTNVNSSNALNIAYDSKGNITSKFDAGSYTYDGSKINQVIEASNPSGVISTTQQDITYTLFDKTKQIIEGTEEVQITYGPTLERMRTDFYSASALTKSRYYANAHEVDFDNVNNPISSINYINSPTGLCAIRVTQGANSNIYYPYSNYLGTILKITDETGNTITEQNYDAWGRRRNPNTWQYNGLNSIPTWLYRGFTGHEHLPQFDLVNMNGRMYDPILSRMLSVDPVLQDPASTQAHNKYSYALNNPLKFTDPSGYFTIGGAANSTLTKVFAPFHRGPQGQAAPIDQAVNGMFPSAKSPYTDAQMAGTILGDNYDGRPTQEQEDALYNHKSAYENSWGTTTETEVDGSHGDVRNLEDNAMMATREVATITGGELTGGWGVDGDDDPKKKVGSTLTVVGARKTLYSLKTLGGDLYEESFEINTQGKQKTFNINTTVEKGKVRGQDFSINQGPFRATLSSQGNLSTSFGIGAYRISIGITPDRITNISSTIRLKNGLGLTNTYSVRGGMKTQKYISSAIIYIFAPELAPVFGNPFKEQVFKRMATN